MHMSPMQFVTCWMRIASELLDFSDLCDVEVVLDSGADGSVPSLEFGAVGYRNKFFDASEFLDAQGKPINVKGARIAEVVWSGRFQLTFYYFCSDFTTDLHGQIAERLMAFAEEPGWDNGFVQTQFTLCNWCHSNA